MCYGYALGHVEVGKRIRNSYYLVPVTDTEKIPMTLLARGLFLLVGLL
jgi:hypothetical protein